MPSSKNSPSDRSPPTIRIHSASPDTTSDRPQSTEPTDETPTTGLTPRRTRSLPLGNPRPEHQRHRRKRSATSAKLSTTQEVDQPDPKMASGSSRSGSGSSRKQSSSSASSSKKSKSSHKDADWSDVTDPEERRRIQNRIAQRKFREKARESKEKAERESRNQENAGNSYRIPSPNDFTPDSELSGLPWGSVNVRHFITRGHEAESRRSSGRGTYVGDDGFTPENYGMVYGNQWTQSASYGGSSGGDEVYYDDAYLYDPTGQGR